MARKNKITITISQEALSALDKLRGKLQKENYPYGPSKKLEALHGPLRYNRSTVIEMAIRKFIQDHRGAK